MPTRKTNKQFLTELKQVHANKLIPLEPYIDSDTKIWFHCNVCNNEWKTIPYSILKKHGCPKCGLKKRAKTQSKSNEQFSIELQQAHGEKITPLEPYNKSSTKIRFRCNVCSNEWNAIPNTILSGYGCPKCGRKNQIKSRSKAPEQFLMELQQVHGKKITPLEPYNKGSTKIRFHCNVCSNEWKAAPAPILKGHGCPKCGLKKRAKDRTKTEKQFLIGLSQVHGSKITPLEPYNKSHTNIKFHCNVCNKEWRETPHTILRGAGCPKCSLKKRAKGRIKTTEQFLRDLKQVHGNKITALEPYTSSRTKVKFHCLVCGNDWETTPNSILMGNGCPKCAGNIQRTPEQFLRDLKQIQGSQIIPLEPYNGRSTKIRFHCNTCNHNWKAVAGSLLSGEGCPYCASSSGEKIVSSILETNHVIYQRQYKIDILGHRRFFDFYLELNGKKYFIEYDGIQHTKKNNRYYTSAGHVRDIEKDNYAVLIGAKMIRIPYTLDTLEKVTIKLSYELGTKLITPAKAYLPLYKRKSEIAKYYLKHSGKKTCNIFQISNGTLTNDFKQIYGYNKQEYVTKHPQLKKLRKNLKGRKPILCTDTNTKYNSITEAAKKFNVNKSDISAHLAGRTKTAAGLHFKYLNKNQERSHKPH